MYTEWIKYKEVCGSSVNSSSGNFTHPYQNVVVKEAEPYSLFVLRAFLLIPWWTLERSTWAREVYGILGVLCRRKALLREENHVPLHPEQRRQWLAPLATPWHIPWSPCLQAGQAASLQDTDTACSLRAQPTMGFLLLKTSNIKKEKMAEQSFNKSWKQRRWKDFGALSRFYMTWTF